MPALDQWELKILDWIVATFHCGFLDAVMPKISFLGNGGWFWIVLVLLLMIRKRDRQTALTAALALLFSLLVANVVLKPLIGRVRPYDLDAAIHLTIPPPAGYSFPSGHAQASFAAATAIYRNKKKAGKAALLLASLIALSRLYLCLHYPSDVLAGALFGIILGIIADYLVNRLKKKRRPPKRKSR